MRNLPESPVQPAEQATSSSTLGQHCELDSTVIETCEDPAPWPKRLSTAQRHFLTAKSPHKLDLNSGFPKDGAGRKSLNYWYL